MAELPGSSPAPSSRPPIEHQSLVSIDDQVNALYLHPESHDKIDLDSNGVDNDEPNLEEREIDGNGEEKREIEVQNMNQGENVGEDGDEKGESSKNRFPVRSEAEGCSLYLRTGSCYFGVDCIFNHPLSQKIQGTKVKTEDESVENDAQNVMEQDKSSDKEGRIDSQCSLGYNNQQRPTGTITRSVNLVGGCSKWIDVASKKFSGTNEDDVSKDCCVKTKSKSVSYEHCQSELGEKPHWIVAADEYYSSQGNAKKMKNNPAEQYSSFCERMAEVKMLKAMTKWKRLLVAEQKVKNEAERVKFHQRQLDTQVIFADKSNYAPLQLAFHKALVKDIFSRFGVDIDQSWF